MIYSCLYRCMHFIKLSIGINSRSKSRPFVRLPTSNIFGNRCDIGRKYYKPELYLISLGFLYCLPVSERISPKISPSVDGTIKMNILFASKSKTKSKYSSTVKPHETKLKPNNCFNRKSLPLCFLK